MRKMLITVSAVAVLLFTGAGAASADHNPDHKQKCDEARAAYTKLYQNNPSLRPYIAHIPAQIEAECKVR